MSFRNLYKKKCPMCRKIYDFNEIAWNLYEVNKKHLHICENCFTSMMDIEYDFDNFIKDFSEASLNVNNNKNTHMDVDKS